MNINKLLQIGIVNTVRINSHYFGIKGILRPVILVGRHTKIGKLSGKIVVNESYVGMVTYGLGHVGIVDNKYRRSMLENTGVITFSGKAHFGPGTRITCAGDLTFGNNAAVNANSDIVCNKEIHIGNDFLMSWECLLMDTDYHAIYAKSDMTKRINDDKPITIGNHVWVGCRSIVLKGSSISDGNVVAAGSIVTGKLEHNDCIYASDEIMKQEIYWSL